MYLHRVRVGVAVLGDWDLRVGSIESSIHLGTAHLGKAQIARLD